MYGIRQLRTADPRADGLVIDDPVKRVDRGIGPERMFAGEQLVQNDAEREDVAGWFDLLTPRLFGRHIAKRAGDLAALSGFPAGAGSDRVIAPGAPGKNLGKSEVDELDVAVDADHHVFRLDVAMHDSAVMGRSQA